MLQTLYKTTDPAAGAITAANRLDSRGKNARQPAGGNRQRGNGKPAHPSSTGEAILVSPSLTQSPRQHSYSSQDSSTSNALPESLAV